MGAILLLEQGRPAAPFRLPGATGREGLSRKGLVEILVGESPGGAEPPQAKGRETT